MAFQRDLILSIAFLPSWRSGRKQLIPEVFLVLFWLISQKHSTVCHVIVLLLNTMLMELVFLHLNLIQYYLANQKQSTKINDSYSSWNDIHFGVPQGSTLALLLFNIFSSDLFLIATDVNIASYADDNILWLMWYYRQGHIIIIKLIKRTFHRYQTIRWRVTLKSVML